MKMKRDGMTISFLPDTAPLLPIVKVWYALNDLTIERFPNGETSMRSRLEVDDYVWAMIRAILDDGKSAEIKLQTNEHVL